MMFALRYLTRKFLEMEMYCVNSLAKRFSLIFAHVKNSLNEFFKVIGGVMLEGSAKRSNCESVQNSFTETVVSFFSFRLIDLSEKPEFCELITTKFIAQQ